MDTNIIIKKYLMAICLCLSFGVVNLAVASGSGGGQSLGAIVTTVQGNILSVVKLLIVIAYIAGVGFALVGILQFKAHKDNPQQTPLSKPMIYLAVAACLLFLPSIMSTAGKTLFGTNVGTTGGSTLTDISGATATTN